MSAELQSQIDQNRVILGGSTNVFPGEGHWYERYLVHPRPHLEPLVSGRHVVLITYAHPDLEGSVQGIGRKLRGMGARTIVGTHEYPGSEESVIDDAEAIYFEGGDTGILVANLHSSRHIDGGFVDTREMASRTPLVDPIRRKASIGTPIIGFSAGFNVLTSDTRTTNDMASALQRTEYGLVVRHDAIGLFPKNLNINPHYPRELEDKINYTGENRAERIQQVLKADPSRRVLALREDAYVMVSGMKMALEGTMGGVLFEAGKEPQELENGDISFLLEPPAKQT